MKPEISSVPGTLVVFIIGRSLVDLEATDEAAVKAQKSAPSYPDIIPRQKVIKLDQRAVRDEQVGFLVKAYSPDTVVVEATSAREDIFSEETLNFKRLLVNECRKALEAFSGPGGYDEEYSVYCVSGYSGDPEIYLSLFGERMAALLKNEDVPLDEEEIQTTLASSLKYGKNDITVVDWDGAFIFDAEGDFQGDIELFEIANMQLLKSRMLAAVLDARLERTLRMIRTPKKLPALRTGEVRKVMREIIEIRTQSILESEAVERTIKLIGDWYSARLYSLIAKKFHLDDWKTQIKEKLDTLEDVYTMASENFSVSYRAALEFVILAGWLILLLLYVGEFIFMR